MTLESIRLAYQQAKPIAANDLGREWPSPLPLPSTLPDVPAFEAGMLPLDLRAWAVDIAERMQVPLDFVGIPAMVAAGSVLGRGIGIRPEMKTDWLEVCNLWGCIVAPPGAMKSPAIREALAAVRRLEAQASKANQEALANFQRSESFYKLECETARDLARKELKDGGRQAAQSILDQIQPPAAPVEKRLMATDVTVEKLGEICAANPRGVLLNRDELLTMFVDLGRDEKAPARGFLLSGWSGLESYSFDRITRGTVRIPSVNLSVIGSTQPHRISSYLRESLRFHDDGMIQRLQLLAWPDHSKRWQSTDRYPDTSARVTAFSCYERLANLDPALVGAERDQLEFDEGVPFLRFAPDALVEFEKWRCVLEERIRSEELAPHLAAHISKYRGLIPRLALIYHLASGGVGSVTLEPLLAALAWAEYLEAHAIRAYHSMAAANSDVAKAILRRIRKRDISDGFTERDIYRRDWGELKDREAIATGLKLLEDYDWLWSERIATGGRPTVKWWINPATYA